MFLRLFVHGRVFTSDDPQRGFMIQTFFVPDVGVDENFYIPPFTRERWLVFRRWFHHCFVGANLMFREENTVYTVANMWFWKVPCTHTTCIKVHNSSIDMSPSGEGTAVAPAEHRALTATLIRRGTVSETVSDGFCLCRLARSRCENVSSWDGHATFGAIVIYTKERFINIGKSSSYFLILKKVLLPLNKL